MTHVLGDTIYVSSYFYLRTREEKVGDTGYIRVFICYSKLSIVLASTFQFTVTIMIYFCVLLFRSLQCSVCIKVSFLCPSFTKVKFSSDHIRSYTESSSYLKLFHFLSFVRSVLFIVLGSFLRSSTPLTIVSSYHF